jgi:glucose-1-phosphate thymidylyltransferase
MSGYWEMVPDLDWKFHIRYRKPPGACGCIYLGEEFIGDDSVCLILGDNVFYGQDLTRVLNRAKALEKGAVIFGYPVKDARSFGVVEFDKNHKVISIEEKPPAPEIKLCRTRTLFL